MKKNISIIEPTKDFRFLKKKSDLFHYVPPFDPLHYVPLREKECYWIIFIHPLFANLPCYFVNQLITSDILTLFDGLSSKTPLSQSEEFIHERRSALLELVLDFIHVFKSVSLCPPPIGEGGVKQIQKIKNYN